jgi:hypothetical protein
LIHFIESGEYFNLQFISLTELVVQNPINSRIVGLPNINITSISDKGLFDRKWVETNFASLGAAFAIMSQSVWPYAIDLMKKYTLGRFLDPMFATIVGGVIIVLLIDRIGENLFHHKRRLR